MRFCLRPATQHPRVTELTLDGCLSRKWDVPKVDLANCCEVVLGSNPADRHTSTGGLVALSNEDNFYVGSLLTWWNKKLTKKNNCQCADQGCLSRIPIFSIPNPGSALKNLSIWIQKIVSKLSKYDPGCSSRIRFPDLDPDILLNPDPGVKKAPEPGSGSTTLIYVIQTWIVMRWKCRQL